MTGERPEKNNTCASNTNRPAVAEAEENNLSEDQEEHFSLPFGLFIVIAVLGLCLLIFESTRTFGWVLLVCFAVYLLIGFASIVIRGNQGRD
jgi:uncharacterized membrane protein